MVTPFNFGPIRNTAQTLIDKFGRSCVLLRPTQATPADPNKPWRVGDGTLTQYPFRAPYSAIPFPKRSEPIVDSTEADLLMPGNVTTDSLGNVGAAIEPLLTDRVQILGLIAGETNPVYAITGIHRIDPDGTPIAYGLRICAWSDNVAAPASPI